MPSPFPGMDPYLESPRWYQGEGGQFELTAVIDSVPQADSHVPQAAGFRP